MRAYWLAPLVIVPMIVIAALTAAAAQNQNLDHDKSGATLFAASCADCHRSPRGLAKQRLSFMLTYYLRQHYTSSTASAQSLAAYLQAADAPRAKAAARKAQTGNTLAANRKPPMTTGTATRRPGDPVLRPPVAVPKR